MWLLVTRQPRPDAPYCAGRRWLAAVDAVLWPAFWVMVFGHAPSPVGLVVPMATVAAIWFAVAGLRRAIWANHHYHFSAWRWSKAAMALALTGGLLKCLV